MLSRPSNQIDLVALTNSHLSTSSTVVQQFSETGCVMSSTELFNLSKYHHALSRLLSSLVSRNYCGITLTSVISKTLEIIILDRLAPTD